MKIILRLVVLILLLSLYSCSGFNVVGYDNYPYYTTYRNYPNYGYYRPYTSYNHHYYNRSVNNYNHNNYGHRRR
jgi:hypothetical protein